MSRYESSFSTKPKSNQHKNLKNIYKNNTLYKIQSFVLFRIKYNKKNDKIKLN